MMKGRRHFAYRCLAFLIVSILALSGAGIGNADTNIAVPNTPQEHSQWCWAGTSEAVLSYYQNAVNQGAIANWAWGRSDCSGNTVFYWNHTCNEPNYMFGTSGSLQGILSHWGVNSNARYYALSQETCVAEINAGRPFVMRFGWTSGGGHFLDGYGYDQSGTYLDYMDPWPGNGYTKSLYSWVVSASDHEWTHSLQITTNPTTCSYSISPMSATGNTSAGSGHIAITASAGTCPWTATSNANWITITSGSTGTGDGTVGYSYTANNTGASRTGTIIAAGQTFTLTQEFVSSGAYKFVLKWGSEGTSDGQFYFPRGIGVDKSGNVYVASGGLGLNSYRDRQRIQKFGSTGSFITKWDPFRFDTNLDMEGLSGVAVNALSDVYVVNCGGHFMAYRGLNRIQKFSSTGSLINQWGSLGSSNGQFTYPQGVAVDASGNVYVADTVNNRIQKFSSTGAFIAKWGSRGSSNGQFMSPMGVAVDASGNVYVADSGNYRIQKFSSTGSFITKWGSQGSGDSQFQYPNGIAVDASGNVYVADTNNHRIMKFTSTGVFITKWGSEGSGDSQFQQPYGIAVDASGNVYVADTNNHRIQKFAPKNISLPWLPLLLE